MVHQRHVMASDIQSLNMDELQWIWIKLKCLAWWIYYIKYFYGTVLQLCFDLSISIHFHFRSTWTFFKTNPWKTESWVWTTWGRVNEGIFFFFDKLSFQDKNTLFFYFYFFYRVCIIILSHIKACVCISVSSSQTSVVTTKSSIVESPLISLM